jgi:hypothetical protein
LTQDRLESLKSSLDYHYAAGELTRDAVDRIFERRDRLFTETYLEWFRIREEKVGGKEIIQPPDSRSTDTNSEAVDGRIQSVKGAPTAVVRGEPK